MTIYKITQTETFFGQADSLDDAHELFNEGVFDCASSLTVEIIEADFSGADSQLKNEEEKNRTFTFLSGETYDVKATSLQEAEERLYAHMRCDESEYVEEGEILTELISRPCLECPPDAKGWHKHDDAGITFEGLKQAQNEAILHGVKMAMDYLEEINCHSGARAVNELKSILEDGGTFFSSFALYSTECEGSN